MTWTNLYKYLGFMLRSDLLDDHAYERVEKKTKAAAERLFPHHRLVRSWPLGQKLQLLQTIVLSISTNVMPLLSSMRCISESKTKLWKRLPAVRCASLVVRASRMSSPSLGWAM